MRHARFQLQRRGTILIVTMLACFTLAAMVLVMCRSTRVEALASANIAASIQADAVERGAEQYVTALLADQAQAVLSLTDDQFAGIRVGDGYFWIVRPTYDDPNFPAFGLVDEGSKVNINSADASTLAMLPQMADDIADAILDWRDSDSTPRSSGAEDEYYGALPEGYSVKNRPFETVEELMLVRGITREMLHGTGQATPMGTTNSKVFNDKEVGVDPSVARGIYDLLTIYSSETDISLSGSPKVNVKTGSRKDLSAALEPALGKTRASAIVAAAPPNPGYRNIFSYFYRSGMTPDEFAQVDDYLKAPRTAATPVAGRINVNTAPREVLRCLRNLTDADVDNLLASRPPIPDQTSMAWVAKALGQSKAEGLGDSITARSYQYSADIVATNSTGRAFKHVRIVVDTASGTPQIVYRRDLTAQGWPMDRQVLDSLRAGEGAGQYAAGSLTTTGMR